MDLTNFLSNNKSILIAPAGHGKTHAIVECLKYSEGLSLILTHTHAGVASIREKVKKEEMANVKYHIETISSFLQRLVLSFDNNSEKPQQENSKEYHEYINTSSLHILKKGLVRKVISLTYTRLFVDEYQDCSLQQHQAICILSTLFPTHLFGDSMQGIFDFQNQDMVDIENDQIMGDFNQKRYFLEEPWRWKNVQREDLGRSIISIRNSLLNKEQIYLEHYKEDINIIKVKAYEKRKESNLYTEEEQFKKYIYSLKAEKSVLIIFPEAYNTDSRKEFIKFFGDSFFMIESIDDKKFYDDAKLFDSLSTDNYETILSDFFLNNFTNLGEWMNGNRFKTKRDAVQKQKVENILKLYSSLKNGISLRVVSKIVKLVFALDGVRTYRKDLYNSLLIAFENAFSENITVFEAMKNHRNNIRRVGRKVFGKCVGTTLLTKGLEFDKVVVINAHKFNCPKNLYVSLSRACKELTIVTNSMILEPYK